MAGKCTDLSNKRFGKLVVISRNGNDKHRRAKWLCQCDCGNTITTIAQNLINGGTRSCGCYHSMEVSTRLKGIPVLILSEGQAAFNILYGRYKKSAEKRGLSFNLTKEQFRELTNKNCYYCGGTPNQVIFKRDANGVYTYNGIDRVNNEIGYEIENCVSCCKHCNIMKNSFNKDEFKNHIIKIYNHLVKDGEI